MANGFDFSNIDKDAFEQKVNEYKLALEARKSVNDTIKNVKNSAAEVLKVKKGDVKTFIDMYIKLQEDGEIEDEEKASAIKELFLKKGED